MIDKRVLENVGALEKGVIIPTCNVQDQLRKMPAHEARTAKRKWRKLKRRVLRKMKDLGVEDSRLTKKATIYHIRSVLREIGKDKLGV